MSNSHLSTTTPGYEATDLPRNPPTSPHRNLNLASLYKWTKFRTVSSANLWLLYAASMSLMFIVHISYIFPGGLQRNLAPEHYFNYRIKTNKYPLLIHLSSILPAGILATFQFIPRVRQRFTTQHRVLGQLINILTVISTLSALPIARISFGGNLSIQLAIYVLGVMTLYSMVASWKAIRQQQIDEHRKWIIRSWGYQASIVTTRLIMFIAIAIIVTTGGHYATMPCDEVANSLNDSARFAQEYPQCLPTWSGKPVKHVSIQVSVDSTLGIAAGTRAVFGMSLWVALWIHAVGVEYYLFKTRSESERLRQVSLKRQNIRQKLLEGDKVK